MTITAGARTRFVLLAPSRSFVPRSFPRVVTHRNWHEELLARMQILRGRTYLQDGAIEARQLSDDGRHRLAIDRSSWHLLAIDERARLCGCVRYLEHRNTAPFDSLSLRTAALALSDQWGSKLKAAVESEMDRARHRDLPYVEVGGWAIPEDRRCGADAVRLALATFSLAQLLGGCLGITTATTRHHSSTILRKIGGHSLAWDGAELPPYYDPQYKCQMEILRFDSSSPGDRFAAWIEELQLSLLETPVICGSEPEDDWPLRTLGKPLDACSTPGCAIATCLTAPCPTVPQRMG